MLCNANTIKTKEKQRQQRRMVTKSKAMKQKDMLERLN